MLLLAAIAAGLCVGLAWAGWQRRPYQVPALRSTWLAFAAFLPQLLIAYFPATRHLLADWLASLVLLISLGLFAAFAWRNRHIPGMPILLAGLTLNFLVMAANGGWMPISPQTASQLSGIDVVGSMNQGSRFGQKDILLLSQNTHFELLADRFLLPDWIRYKAAFSFGDILISMGAFWLLVHPSIEVGTLPLERVHLDHIQ